MKSGRFQWMFAGTNPVVCEFREQGTGWNELRFASHEASDFLERRLFVRTQRMCVFAVLIEARMSDAEPEQVISPVGVGARLSVRAQGLLLVAERPVFCIPLAGPTENTTVLPACKLSVTRNGASWPTEVTLELNTTFPSATIPTTVPTPYCAPRKLPAVEYSPLAGTLNIRSEYCPPIPATS